STAHGVALRHLALPGSFPAPDRAALASTRDILAAIDPEAILLVDGLAYGALPATLCAAIPNPIVALV
ncbi:hypothetical protein, partial [Streptococcus pneumoniae]|uniref:hypothetical protein n=1 Tax=Streptococcus pneumoniae TaxID=1313 RepID=UPI0019544B67